MSLSLKKGMLSKPEQVRQATHALNRLLTRQHLVLPLRTFGRFFSAPRWSSALFETDRTF